ncbi:antirestriction protein [Paraburkholderia sp. EG304]|uniref:antirestriction protein n=1 Tax=Paraburkholderia sp. EG304 TaxID=3237015 RepID=UPI00397CB3EF
MKKALATLVPESRRLGFLPGLFGERRMIRGEALVYAWANRLSPDYTGGLWNFYKLSNGGAYLAPTRPERFNVAAIGSGYEGEMSADAFGVVVTLFALGQVAFEVAESARGADSDKLVDSYHALRSFALDHAEAASILRAID